MRANAGITLVSPDAEILPVLVTPVVRAENGALPHLAQVACWPLDEFRRWAREALNVVRELRRTMGTDADLAWRAEAQAKFAEKGYDAANLMQVLKGLNAEKFFKKKPS